MINKLFPYTGTSKGDVILCYDITLKKIYCYFDEDDCRCFSEYFDVPNFYNKIK